MTQTYVTVRGAFTGPTSAVRTGAVTFEPFVNGAVDQADLNIMLGQRVIALLDQSGRFSIALVPTDDPARSPLNWVYLVTEDINGAPSRQYYISVPISAASTGIDLATVSPVGQSDGFVAQGPTLGAFLALQARILPIVYVDFTTRANGAEPTKDDAGNTVNNFVSGGNPPIISSGKLIAQPTTNAAYASYFQVAPGGDGLRVGAEFVVSMNDGGVTSATVALWDHNYAGATVPESRAHVGIVPGTGQWIYSIADGAGHFVDVGSGFFTPPAYDGVAVWRLEAFVDSISGNAYVWLPDDTIVTITAAHVATVVAGTAGWAASNSLATLSGKVAQVEHFAANNALANIAAFPKFTSFWASRAKAPAYQRQPNTLDVVKSIVRSAGEASWTKPTLNAGWTNNPLFEPVGFRKLAGGVVELRGFITGPGNTQAFTLPAGYRPPTNTIFRPCISDQATNVCFSVIPTGEVTVFFNAPATSVWLTGTFDTTA